MWISLQGFKRKVIYVGLYEFIAIIFSALLLQWMTDGNHHSLGIAIAASAVAIVWNVIFNYGFEFWEARNNYKDRTLARRLLHACGFEGGLLVFLVPLLAWWLSVSWQQALLMDLGLLVFFLVYTFVFNWLFDVVFGLPGALISTATPAQPAQP